MNLSAIVLSALAFGAGALATTSFQGGPPEPGPEHKILAAMAGTWDAEVKMMGQVSTGTFKTELLGGRWLVGDFEGTMMGMPLHGRDVMGWDPAKKQYVGCWVDNMAAELGLTSGSASADGKSLTLDGETHDPMSGAPASMRNVYTLVGPDHIRFDMHVGDPKAPAMMTIDYKRKK